jgi:DNA ligase (NAD+)
LLEHYKNDKALLAALKSASSHQPNDAYRQLADDSEIGTVATNSLIEFFSEQHNRDVVDALLAELETVPIATPVQDSLVTGKTIVFTGSLERMTRDEAKATAERLGAKVSGSVSRKTDFVVAGPGAGSKLSDAKKYDVKVISEDDWVRMVEKQ